MREQNLGTLKRRKYREWNSGENLKKLYISHQGALIKKGKKDILPPLNKRSIEMETNDVFRKIERV